MSVGSPDGDIEGVKEGISEGRSEGSALGESVGETVGADATFCTNPKRKKLRAKDSFIVLNSSLYLCIRIVCDNSKVNFFVTKQCEVR